MADKSFEERLNAVRRTYPEPAGGGETAGVVAAAIGCSRHTIYRWRKERRIIEILEGEAQVLAEKEAKEEEERRRLEAVARAHLLAAEAEAEAEMEARVKANVLEFSTTKGKRGRPSKIQDRGLRALFLEGVELGLSNTHLADLVGVSSTTIKNWFEGADGGEGSAAEWGAEIRSARGKGVLEAHRLILEGGSAARGAMWILSHRYPELYSPRREVVSIEGDPHADVSDEELDEIIEQGKGGAAC